MSVNGWTVIHTVTHTCTFSVSWYVYVHAMAMYAHAQICVMYSIQVNLKV